MTHPVSVRLSPWIWSHLENVGRLNMVPGLARKICPLPPPHPSTVFWAPVLSALCVPLCQGQHFFLIIFIEVELPYNAVSGSAS